jgi:hypothetical protein
MDYRWYDVRGAECFCFELAIRRTASRMRRSGLYVKERDLWMKRDEWIRQHQPV